MQAQSVTQETPLSSVSAVPPLGVPGTMDQAVPFQFATNVAGVGPVAADVSPTAEQVVALKHETPVRLWLSELVGPVAMAQPDPFQLSMKAWLRLLAPYTPTAVQKPTPAHDTERRIVLGLPDGAGMETDVQLVPFHSSL